MKIRTLITLFSLMSILSCSKDDSESQSLINKIQGEHAGEYSSIACSFFQTILFSDPQSNISITETGDSTLSAELFFNEDGVQNSFNFTGTAVADSMVRINDFEFESDAYFGNLFLQDDGKIRILLSNDCTLFNEPGVTEIFQEN